MTDAELFQELLRCIAVDPMFDKQAFDRAIKANRAALKISGLLGIEGGQDVRWPYPIDRKRLREGGGPAVLAQEFLAGYRAARESYRPGE